MTVREVFSPIALLVRDKKVRTVLFEIDLIPKEYLYHTQRLVIVHFTNDDGWTELH